MEKYIILKKPPISSKTLRGISGKGYSSPSIAIEQLNQKDVVDVSRDPETIAIAKPMKTRLIRPTQSLDNSTAHGDSWGIAAVNAHLSPYTGSGVKIAVLDTGIDRSHLAFKGIELIEKDFTEEGNGDRNGHGTHCAGTIFGQDIDNRRIGVARGVKRALIGKVIGEQSSSSDNLFKAMYWALGENANIVSMSLGFDFPGEVQDKIDRGWPADLATSEALDNFCGNLRLFDSIMAVFKSYSAFNNSPLVIAAAGNESQRLVNSEYRIATSLPAAAQGVLSVAAATSHSPHNIAHFSNSLPHITAPGVDVISAWPGGGLRSMDGTSMACPHAAGVAALWWESLKEQNAAMLSQAVFSNLIAQSRRDCFSSEFNASDFGHGLVSAPL